MVKILPAYPRYTKRSVAMSLCGWSSPGMTLLCQVVVRLWAFWSFLWFWCFGSGEVGFDLMVLQLRFETRLPTRYTLTPHCFTIMLSEHGEVGA